RAARCRALLRPGGSYAGVVAPGERRRTGPPVSPRQEADAGGPPSGREVAGVPEVATPGSRGVTPGSSGPGAGADRLAGSAAGLGGSGQGSTYDPPDPGSPGVPAAAGPAARRGAVTGCPASSRRR